MLAEAKKSDPLFQWKKGAEEKLALLGAPSKKEERYRYMTLSKAVSSPAEREGAQVALEGEVPSSLLALPIGKAKGPFSPFLEGRLQARLFKEESDFFALWNLAAATEVLFLYVPPHTKIEKPLRLVSSALFPRVHLYVSRGSSLSLERTGEAENSHFDVVLDEGARFFLYEKEASPFQSVRATLKKESQFRFLTAAQSAPFSRASLRVELVEEGAFAELEGLTRLAGESERHIHALLEHRAPNCRSRQHFKTVLGGSALASFQGKIYVEPIAQKTESYQLARTLLLSEEAKMRVVPNLEIFADDVKASHGATIGQIDQEALHYLRARGIGQEEASRLLIEGFCQEIWEKFP